MQLIGSYEIKSDGNASLKIAIPFWSKMDFFVVVNNIKEGNKPDFIIFNNNIKVGGLWKNVSVKNGDEKKYLSGSIFCPGYGMENNQLKIVIFKNQEKKSENFSGLVFWNMDNKKQVDQETESLENLVHDADLF